MPPPTPTSADCYLTLTALAFRRGGHSRHKELVRALLAAGKEVLWIGPSREDVEDLPGVVYLPLAGRLLLGVPLAGRVLAYLASLRRHRRALGRVGAVVVLRDLELLAVRFFAPLGRLPVFLVLRNDLVRKAEVRAASAPTPWARWAQRLRAAFFRRLQRRLYPSAAGIVVQTPAIARELSDRLGRAIRPPDVVPNHCRPSWTDAAPEDRRRQWQERRGQALVGFVGNLLWEVKGLDLLLAAFAAIRRRRDARLIVIGGGADLPRLVRAAQREPFRGAVEVVGPVPNAFRLMGSLDVLLVPSRYDDCPNVVLEALAAGLPVVASDIDAHAFLLGEVGALVPAGDPPAMAERALRLLGDPEDRRRLLAAQGERRRRFDFDWGAEMVRRLDVAAREEPGKSVSPVGSQDGAAGPGGRPEN